MRLTLIHPCVGRRRGQPYIRTWQMEPLAPATIAGFTPPGSGIDVRFYDDRTEAIPYDEPTDLVAMSVETYTAKRCVPDRLRVPPPRRSRSHGRISPDAGAEEASDYAEAIVVGEAEGVWPRLLNDFAAGRLQRVYRQARRPPLSGLRPDRSIFAGKRYLPVGLVEAGRGCHFRCEFCAVQSYFGHTQTRRPSEEILEEVRR